MDKGFQAVVSFYKPLANITHTQQVQRLYRKYVERVAFWACS